MSYPMWCKGSFSYLWVVVNGKRFKILASIASITTLILILNCGRSGGGTPPSNGALEVELVLGGLDFPVTLACASDGRIFFNELRTGNIRIIRDGVLLPTPFAAVPVSINGENGLIGLAFHPQFDRNGLVYVFHTHPQPRRNRVLRFTDLNNLGTQETVIIDDLPAADIHIGGNVGFGPDGKLYVTIGDVSNPANSQSLDSLAGKILRYNPDGTIPADNPFLDSPIFALGLRNSFDFTFHPATGVIYATENGPNCDDEINRIIAGGNYGWRPNYPVEIPILSSSVRSYAFPLL
ncbi:MAG TPA: PQQ-dependent sugar dehydrogenase [Thermodesulfobacteriota bacterium]|nr:PQQ-dependent sugar dehydrogenase [Thermodesulfobacteriota bacterium]